MSVSLLTFSSNLQESNRKKNGTRKKEDDDIL